MKKILTAISALCISFAGCAEPLVAGEMKNMKTEHRENSKTENEVKAVVRSMISNMLKADVATMANVLSPDFTLTHITGYRQSRTEWLDEIRQERMKYYSAEEVSLTVSFERNDRAEVKIRNLVDARIRGSRNTWKLQQVIVLEKRNGQWVILRSVATLF